MTKKIELYERPRAYVGMTVCTNEFGQRQRETIHIWLSRFPEERLHHTCENLVQAANLIADSFQLLRLPEGVFGAAFGQNIGVEQLHPVQFDWLKRLITGAPWDVTAQVAIGEPQIPAAYPD